MLGYHWSLRFVIGHECGHIQNNHVVYMTTLHFLTHAANMYVRWLVFIMIISLFGRVDMAAHVGGLAGGFGVAYLAGQPRYEGSITEKLWRVAGVLCFFLTVASFLLWYLWFRTFSA